ncbi:MAG: cellulase family glycosylhydrolase [Armatimonadetes bacterium]|nr:cellulase family glycosylhydrolase [Armatimonadota bacterium]
MARRGSRIGVVLLLAAISHAAPLERIIVAPDQHGFVLADSGVAFRPWGVNYGHAGKLLEDVWDDGATLEHDFGQMRELGANVVRIHLQVNRFMDGPDRPNAAAFERLGRLVKLAEGTGLYLDLTGLACYRPADTPKWYDTLDESARWAAQAAFWRATAATCQASLAIFCYDLMNEPITPADQRPSWYSGTLFGGYDFIQFIARNPAGRERMAIAAAWLDQLTAAIRAEDREHLITVGMLPWVTGWGHLSGFLPAETAKHLDFLSVHIYPKTKDPAEAERALRECDVGAPLVIEETFPLECTPTELAAFLRRSREVACGWLWHYDGASVADYDAREKAGRLTIAEAIWREALRLFQRLGPEFRDQP